VKHSFAQTTASKELQEVNSLLTETHNGVFTRAMALRAKTECKWGISFAAATLLTSPKRRKAPLRIDQTLSAANDFVRFRL
jgi:hypothetical protein